MVSDRDKSKKKRDPSAGSGQPDESSEPIVRDKRRIDPETGEARQSSDAAGETTDQSEAISDEETISDEDIAKLLDSADGHAESSSDHLNDLKRVQAEYANYRKRVDRDRFVARELAVAEVMTGLLPVLDDLDLAQEHGDLEGSSLALIAQKIRTSFERYGLVRVGEVGEPFDPKIHEAIAQLPGADLTVDTIADVVVPGYLLGERLLRPAKVAVSVPEA